MLKTRFLALVAAFMVGLAPMAAVAQLQSAPAYRSGGQPAAATGVFCLNLDGTPCVFGSGAGGSASYTATSSGSLPVTAGTNKPSVIDLFSHQGVLMFDNLGNYIDLTAPSKLMGADGSTVASTSNPIPTQAQTQTDTVMIGGVNVKEINGVAPSMGNGTANTGAQRVAEASDATANANKGQGATGAAVPSGAIYEGCRAATAAPTAVTDGQLVGGLCGDTGKRVVLPYAIKESAVRGSTGAQTGTGAQAFTGISAPAGSLKFYMTGLQCSNSGANSSIVTLNDSASTVINNPAGGGNNPIFLVPLVWAAATAPTANFGTASTSQYCSAQGYTGL